MVAVAQLAEAGLFTLSDFFLAIFRTTLPQFLQGSILEFLETYLDTQALEHVVVLFLCTEVNTLRFSLWKTIPQISQVSGIGLLSTLYISG